MKKEYIPILVEVGEKQELWRIDVTNLSVTELIELRNSLVNTSYNKTIQLLNKLIKQNIEIIVPLHNINSGSYVRASKKNRKEENRMRKIKNIRRKYEKHKR